MIIGIISILLFIPKFIAVCLISHLNKIRPKEEKYNAIYYFSSDKCIWWNAREGFYFLPSISSTFSSKELVFDVKWLAFTYTIAYYYKHAND